ncbi:hypothetical protein G7Z17_g13620 [Cylindrodendrum hubeiense]|uniref:Chromo domain-containing protein n=1 Tax=Cylindrodendrum hubeiense TaxID=595255 RepID=A0A9P5GT88_9HYPO|nr:hypothetical protein G7Z17_g13620 [Cylindrodendrum hubeiense]
MAASTSAMMDDSPLKRKRETHGKTRIEIHIPSKPRQYVTGSGPPLQRISLLPPEDSTAYILERIMLPSPGLAADGNPLPKRMIYLVGWKDLRAACLRVPAMQVLDYVSPMALEEWEWEMEEEMDKERAKMEKERKLEKTKPKRRGRPPAHGQIKPAAVAAPHNNAMKTGRPTKGAMSTTPTKARLQDFAGLSDDESSPSRQLEREQLESSHVSADDDLDDVDMATYQPDLQDLPVNIQRDTINKKSLESRTATLSHAQGNRNLPPNQLVGPFTSTGTSSQRSTPKPAPSTPAASSAAKSSVKTKETPVPLPRIPAIRPPQNGSSPAEVRVSSFTPLGGTSSFASSELRTLGANTPSAAPVPQPRSKDSAKKPKKDAKKTSKPPATNAEENAVPTAPDDDAEPAWEVKSVEATELFEVEGVGQVRYFQVRWEGDWPPEQNPSWEPEANLSKTLVRNFLNRNKKKSTPTKKKRLKQSTLSWAVGQQYKSVTEAFEGGTDDADLLGHQIDDVPTAPTADEGSEELFVVEEPPAKKATKRGSLGWGNRNGTSNGASMEFGVLPAYH